MNNFKKSNYFKSDKHIDNIKKAGIIGNEQIKKLKEERIHNYNLIPKLCKHCNNPLSYQERHKKFCNSSCSAKFNNLKRIVSDDTKEKIKESLNNYHTINKKNKIVKYCENCQKEFLVLDNSKGRRKKKL